MSQFTPSPASPLDDAQTAMLTRFIRAVPDFPQPGILFRDVTPLLQDGSALRLVIDALAQRYRSEHIDQVVGVESRGFIFGAPLAYLLGVGFAPVRKQGKLPSATMSVEYDLEYGSNVLQIHKDALRPGQRALIVDDLLATGGTAAATVQLVEGLGAHVVSLAFLIELAALHGRAALRGRDICALLSY